MKHRLANSLTLSLVLWYAWQVAIVGPAHVHSHASGITLAHAHPVATPCHAHAHGHGACRGHSHSHAHPAPAESVPHAPCPHHSHDECKICQHLGKPSVAASEVVYVDSSLWVGNAQLPEPVQPWLESILVVRSRGPPSLA